MAPAQGDPERAGEACESNGSGSVRAVTDAQGQVLRRHDFRPFGEELAPQNPPRDRKLFTGQERDFETGLDYFFARQLRVDLGRFTVPDPMADLAWADPMSCRHISGIFDAMTTPPTYPRLLTPPRQIFFKLYWVDSGAVRAARGELHPPSAAERGALLEGWVGRLLRA